MREPIEALLRTGRSERDAGRLAEAQRSYATAADLARREGESDLLAYALRHIAELARRAGDANTSLTAAAEAVAIYRARVPSRPLDLANALRLEALAFAELGRGGDATGVWTEAEALYSDAGVEAGVWECREHLEAGTPYE